MKILQLDVQGFRSLKNISWKPADLNILIGPNASGKSNVLHALDMISASAQGRLGEHIRRHGGMEPILYDGSADGFRFSIRYSHMKALGGLRRP
ncbi:MAG TPA: AAA family ATPase, partial [bacterium]|nr:AAA family ATPase [bacterium]